MIKRNILLFIVLCSAFMVEGQKLVRVGLNFGFDIGTNKKDLGENFTFDKSTNFEVGAYVRIGHSFFGQVGGGYYINKTYMSRDSLSSAVELGQINIPILGGYKVALGKTTYFRCMLGIQYRGLVRVSKNGIGATKDTFNKNNMDVIGGIGFDVSVITLDVSYRKAIIPLVDGSKHYQDVVNLSIGFLF